MEEESQVFIIRIWREPREIPGATPLIRGVISHLNSGNEKYLKGLDQILKFVRPYQEALGAFPVSVGNDPDEKPNG